MPKPIGPQIPADAEDTFHELSLEEIAAATYFRIGSHWFMASSVNLVTTAHAPYRPGGRPAREIDQIDMRLIHAHWRGCDG